MLLTIPEKSSVSQFERLRGNCYDLKDSPSLKPYLEEVFAQCYLDAVAQASAETELPVETFPQECPYSSAEVLDSNFLPE